MTLFDQTRTYSFSLKASNDLKSDLLLKKALAVRDFKNRLSIIVCSDFLSFIEMSKFDGFKYSRMIKLLNLSNLKNILESICNKNGIQVTFVQAHYTSQTCSRCGYVSRENRKTQEVFHCQECDFELNADLNAALNILNRLALDVLRHGLLKETDLGFKPKVVSKEVIKKTIEDAYSKSMVVFALKNAA